MKKAFTTLLTASVTTLPLIWTGCQNKTNQEDSCKPGKPNIIFIMADDLGYHDLGCYSQTQIKSPNIDQLAQEGMRFTNCYAGSPVCAPSRSVLMTGQHTGHTTVRGNTSPLVDRPYPYNRVPLNDEDTTVAEVLKKAGYVTGITGKWGLGEPETEGIPNKQGFDEWFGYLNQNHAHSYYPPYLWKKQKADC
ncbi:sulfatase-like hydrolase/transferase [Candidatus Peregrinibacteria bacterium]|nr:sulfatase-like hydrolase/transferase [Candidatus Peregrinibacteria bacterium]